MSALLLLCAAAQWPHDARSLAQWHAERTADDAASAPRADELRERLYVYQGAGAEAEAWAAVEALERLAPGDADGRRYAVQLAAWDPARWNEGLAWADSWLAAHAASRPEAEQRSVATTRALLASRTTARERARARQAARAWVPFGTLGAFALFAILALRRGG